MASSLAFSGLTVGLADSVDILIVALVAYTALRFLNADRHYVLLLVGAAIAGIYFAAHTFDLLLTERLFNLGIITCGIMLAIAFQDDIRRSIHRLGNWQPFQRPQPMSSDYVDTLAEFAFACAGKRIGALVVIKGRDRIDGHLSGGIRLTGPVHLALLHSVFDPHSPGHDGAVIVEDGQITEMCAHLPLGTISGNSAVGGTRHRAALGLSELSDAVVIAVSEERGTVSIAHLGKVFEVKSPNDLKSALDPIRDRGLASNRNAFGVRPFQHAGLKVAALAFAIIGWITLAAHKDIVARTFVVPIEYRNIPAALSLDATAPDDARLSLSGPIPAFDMLETKSLGISIDLSQAVAGPVSIPLGNGNCLHPADVSVDRVSPAIVRLNLVARNSKQD